MDGCEKCVDDLTSARFLTTSRPFPHNSTPVSSQQAARFLTTDPFFILNINRLRGPESELKKKLNFSAVDNFCPVDNPRGCHGATVLAAGKGWVLPVLAMLGPKLGLRVAARGSGPGAKRRRPCPPLRAVPQWKCRDKGRPAATTPQEALPGRASNKRLTRKGERSARPPSLFLPYS